MRERCKQDVWDITFMGMRAHKCSRYAWKDGLCKQHHPDTVALRHAASQARWEAKREHSPYRKLARLAAHNELLESKLKDIAHAFIAYRDSEGCSCCHDIDGHQAASIELAGLLGAPIESDRGDTWVNWRKLAEQLSAEEKTK